MSDLVVVLVVEDDAPLQSIIEDALTDGRFEPAIAASGEEAVTLLMGLKGKYRALVTDVQLRGVMVVGKSRREPETMQPNGHPMAYRTASS